MGLLLEPLTTYATDILPFPSMIDHMCLQFILSDELFWTNGTSEILSFWMSQRMAAQVSAMIELAWPHRAAELRLSWMMTLCRRRPVGWLDRFEQMLHLNFFSRVWISICSSSWCQRLHCLGQMLQGYFMSFRWVSMCCPRLPASVNCVEHSTHMSFFPSLGVSTTFMIEVNQGVGFKFLALITHRAENCWTCVQNLISEISF